MEPGVGHLQVQVLLELRAEHRTAIDSEDQKCASSCLNTSLPPCHCSHSNMALARAVKDELELRRQGTLWQLEIVLKTYFKKILQYITNFTSYSYTDNPDW